MATLITSYSETNQNDYNGLGSTNLAAGEAFTMPGTSYVLNSAKFYLEKIGAPTGNATAKIFASTGTVGTNAVGTGAALATSDTFDISTLSTISYTLITFTFSGVNKITLNASTDYVITCEVGALTGTLQVGDDTTSPTYPGNLVLRTSGGAWSGFSTVDTCFYVYGDDPIGGFTIALV